jgi:hypothetical protein
MTSALFIFPNCLRSFLLFPRPELEQAVGSFLRYFLACTDQGRHIADLLVGIWLGMRDWPARGHCGDIRDEPRPLCDVVMRHALDLIQVDSEGAG